MNVLAKGKIPIVVPRQHKFNEHVNDHQLAFVKKVIEKGYNIKLVVDVDHLLETINSFNQEDSLDIKSHTPLFVEALDDKINQLLGEKK